MGDTRRGIRLPSPLEAHRIILEGTFVNGVKCIQAQSTSIAVWRPTLGVQNRTKLRSRNFVPTSHPFFFFLFLDFGYLTVLDKILLTLAWTTASLAFNASKPPLLQADTRTNIASADHVHRLVVLIHLSIILSGQVPVPPAYLKTPNRGMSVSFQKVLA